MSKLTVLDLFSGAGGAGMGYHLAGYNVVGVDHNPQPQYPFEFIQADALEYLTENGHKYDLIHASPPCQAHSKITPTGGTPESHEDLIPDLRDLLIDIGKPYVIENVEGAPLTNPLTLCGTMFGLMVIRHRLFETNPVIWFPPQPCQHRLKVVKAGRPPRRGQEYHSVVGHFPDQDYAREAMGIDWIRGQYELAQAIPPAYTQFIGECILEAIGDRL